MKVADDFEEFLKLLTEEKVKYLIVGGYAVAYHGQPRFTGDIDIFLEISSVNAAAILQALKKFGFGKLNLTEQDFLIPDRIIQLGYPPLRIDLVTSIDGIDFDEAWSRKIIDLYGQTKTYYISKDDLIRNKKASGRTRDKLDLELLERDN